MKMRRREEGGTRMGNRRRRCMIWRRG